MMFLLTNRAIYPLSDHRRSSKGSAPSPHFKAATPRVPHKTFPGGKHYRFTQDIDLQSHKAIAGIVTGKEIPAEAIDGLVVARYIRGILGPGLDFEMLGLHPCERSIKSTTRPISPNWSNPS